jgi:voltage-gated potassium channel
MDPWRRLRWGLVALVAVLVVGTSGYRLLGFTVLDAVYQTVMTVSTVGFREVEPLSSTGKVFTMAVILVGVGTALFAFSALLEALIEGQVRRLLGRRRMERQIARMRDHVIVCGWGRVGRTTASWVATAGQPVVVIDMDADRLAACPYPTVLGDATDDDVLRGAGLDRARVLIAALNTDADNLYVTLTGRSARPDVFIVARARVDNSADKLRRAGADRVVNPQEIGGARMAAFALQPHVAEFLDVVMHDASLDFRLEEVPVPARSPLTGLTIRDAHIRDRTGALILALRDGDGREGEFATNPPPETVISAGSILIAIGTAAQLEALVDAARAPS